MNLFRRKSVTDLQAEALTDHSLHRALGPVNLTALGVGAIIGTGIFVLTGTVAAQNAGPAVVLSFVWRGWPRLLRRCATPNSPLWCRWPAAPTPTATHAGRVIRLDHRLGPGLEYAVGAITVAVGWSGYVVSFLRDFGIQVPPQLSAARGTNSSTCPRRWRPA